MKGGDVRHVAIIMDGNGRWARLRSAPRLAGHRQGLEAARRAVAAARDLGISCLTLYAFSSENWRRPKQEVLQLMDFVREYIATDLDRLDRQKVRVRVLGARQGLSLDIAQLIEEAQSRTKHNTGMTLAVAFNYGGQSEIVQAVSRLFADYKKGIFVPNSLTPEVFENYLDTAGLPPPDLIIRTGGEKRLSNFLLWQSAYSELVFFDACWPEFTKQMLEEALAEFRRRARRFGAVKCHPN